MYKDFEKQTTDNKESTEINFSWNEYSHYHDYFVELLSYNRKPIYAHSNIWEYSYV